MNPIGSILILLQYVKCETRRTRKPVLVAACLNLHHLFGPGADRINQGPHIFLCIVRMHQESHPVLSLGHDREYNGCPVDTVSHKMERQILAVLGTHPEGHDMCYRHIMPVPILMNGHAKESFGIGFLEDWVRGKCIQVKLG